jgi:hypothetical protein
MRGIIYSANIGQGKLAKYDWAEPHNQDDPGVLFQYTTGVFESRREARYVSRRIKIANPPQNQNGWAAWLDSSMRLTKPIGAKIDEWTKEHQLVVVKHPWRDCAYDEIDECVKLKKVTEEEGETARRELTRRQHPKHYGLYSCGFVVFNGMMFDLRSDWWLLTNMVMRDQFWLPTLVREKNIKTNVLDINIYDNKWFKYKSHGT